MPPKPMPSERGAVSRWAGLPTCEGISGEARYLRALPCSAVLCRALRAMRGAARRGRGAIARCAPGVRTGAPARGFCRRLLLASRVGIWKS